MGGMSYEDNDDEDFMPSIFHTQHRPSQFFPHALPQSFLSAPTYEAMKTEDGGYTSHMSGGPRGVRKSLSASYISLLSAVACADQLGLSMARASGDNFPHHRGQGQGLGQGLGEDNYDDHGEHDRGGVFIDDEDQECEDEEMDGHGRSGSGHRSHHPHHAESSHQSIATAQGQGPRKTRRVGSFSSAYHLNHPVGNGGGHGGGGGGGGGMMTMSGEVSDSGGSSEGASGVSSNNSSAMQAKWPSGQVISHQLSTSTTR